ncbi:helix-turn-helix transcriptional regulator [Klebsiella variicola]|uniref:helix-turn-helix transcriptional regulator n=1 Tax=Klebsiella variicola TaxID=244366 RepID=UPI0013D36EE3|nr:helix-turn-helix transcriptional regulator [Klebsiella variicola]
MSMNVAEKLKIMRESERLTSLPEAAKMLGLNRDALWRYEAGKTIPNTEVIMSILNHPRFEKYALWFITGKIAPESGQIAPALAHFGQDETASQPSDQKIG